RRGMILDARFTPDGNTVVYSALFDGHAAETYSMRLDRPEAQRLDLPPSQLMGVSSSGELALRTGHPGERRYVWTGTLARVPRTGGAPRDVLDGVLLADWAPDGQDLAVLREVDSEYQLERPIGRVVLRPVRVGMAGLAMRVSPRGDRVAVASSD